MLINFWADNSTSDRYAINAELIIQTPASTSDGLQKFSGPRSDFSLANSFVK